VTNFILKAYTLSKGKALAGQKVAQQSVLGERQHFALDPWDCRFAACGFFQAFSHFEFSLLPSRVHAHLTATNTNRWALKSSATSTSVDRTRQNPPI